MKKPCNEMGKDDWEGDERRQRAQDDHDAVIRFAIMISNLQESVKALGQTQDEIKREIASLKSNFYRIIWTCSGVALAAKIVYEYYKSQ